jgi:hypothetical protein
MTKFLTFIVETIHSVDRRALMISSEKEEILRELTLVSEEQANCFQGLFSAINIISQEQVISIWREATVLENSEKIIILSMNVT